MMLYLCLCVGRDDVIPVSLLGRDDVIPVSLCGRR